VKGGRVVICFFFFLLCLPTSIDSIDMDLVDTKTHESSNSRRVNKNIAVVVSPLVEMLYIVLLYVVLHSILDVEQTASRDWLATVPRGWSNVKCGKRMSEGVNEATQKEEREDGRREESEKHPRDKQV